MDKGRSKTLTLERRQLLRDYASGGITWHELRDRGFNDYVEVLGGLGELKLRPPVSSVEGPNAQSRARGRALLRRLLRAQATS